MTFICLICKELITSKSDYELNSGPNSSESVIITTKCGHLYHKACLNQHFVVQRQDEQENGRKPSPTLCPKCQRVVILDNTIQIYPEDSKWNENAYYNLLKEKCALFQENARLKRLLQNQSNQINDIIVNAEIVNLDETTAVQTKRDLITSISDACDESIKITQTLDNDKNYTSIETGISDLTSNNECNTLASQTPVYGNQDYFVEMNANGQPNVSNFEKRLQMYSVKLIETRDKLKGVIDEIEILNSATIDGVTFHIENQITKAASLKGQLLFITHAIENIKKLENEAKDTFETEAIQKLIGSADELENDRRAALESVKRISDILKSCHTKVQKIKTFLKAGFKWLDALEDKLRECNKKESSNEVEFLEGTYNFIYSELISRRYTITTVNQAFMKFLNTPNSKLACKDQNTLRSVFERYDILEREIKTRLQCYIIIPET